MRPRKPLPGKIERRFGALEKRHYHQYLVGLRSFLAGETKRNKVQRTRLTKRLRSLEAEKGQVIENRLGAINAYEYDADTKAHCNKRLKELDREIGAVKSELAKLGSDGKAQVRTFREIIELKENLHRYWLAADDCQKKVICEKLVLNLEVKDRETRSVTWKKPVSDWPKLPDFRCGGGKRPCVEPYFTSLWRSITQEAENWQIKGLISLAQTLNQGISCKDRFRVPDEVIVDGS